MNKGKIIKITEDKLYIGYEDGSLKEINIESCDFEPKLGDKVEVYEGFVMKVDNSNTGTSVDKNTKPRKAIAIVSIITLLLVIIIISFLSVKEQISNKQTTSSSTSKISSSSEKSSTSSSSSSKDNSSSSLTTSSSSSKTKISIDSDKANYSEVDYSKWNHDEIAVNTKVKVYGKVLQAMEDGKSYTLRVAINDEYDKIILVSIPAEYNNRVIAEDDHITLYGLAKGRQSYETVFKSTKTLPYMVAYMYEN